MPNLPLHPAIVHLPLGLAFVLPLIAGAVAWAIVSDRLPRYAWAGVVVLQLLLVGAGIGALRTGEGDEERVETVVPEARIEAHEEAGQLFVWSAGATAVLAALGLFLPAASRRAFMWVAAAATVVVAVLALRTGRAGGELVYGYGAANAHLPGGMAPSAAGPPAERPQITEREGGEHEDDD